MIAPIVKERRSKTLGAMGTWAAVACLLAGGGAGAAVPCEVAPETLRSATTPKRLATALEILESGCQPLLPEIHAAMQTRRWGDRAPLPDGDRIRLLNAGIAHGYDEATAIAVGVLETGEWPDGEPLDPSVGAGVIEGIGPALDEYRIHLLLDIYEQVPVSEVRHAVVQTLRQGEGAAALLPALDAYWTGTGETKVLAAEIIASQPEKEADAVLTRVARELPEGAVLEWAARLGETHGVKSAVEAAKR